jgi:hypothetical protein
VLIHKLAFMDSGDQLSAFGLQQKTLKIKSWLIADHPAIAGPKAPYRNV